MKNLFICLSVCFFSSSFALASRIVNLDQNAVEAAHYLAQCHQLLEANSYSVIGGRKGTFQQGVSYTFDLKLANGDLKALQVRWEFATRKYLCDLLKAN